MRKLLQINYLILVFAVFVIVYRQAFMQRYDKFYNEEGRIILSGNSEVEKYKNNPHLFFYEAKGVHQNKPLLQFVNETVKIDIYEVSYPDHSKTNIHKVVTYLMPIITANEETFGNKDLMYGLYFAGAEDTNITLGENEENSLSWFEIIKFLNLDIYVVDSGYGEMIPVITQDDEDLINKEPIRIEIFTAEEKVEGGTKQLVIERLLVAPLNINVNSFPVRNSLINLFHEKEINELPLEITDNDIERLEEENDVLFTVFHNASKYNDVLYKWFGGYLLIVAFTAYFVFFFRSGNKNLGRVKPTPGLKESIKETKEQQVK